MAHSQLYALRSISLSLSVSHVLHDQGGAHATSSCTASSSTSSSRRPLPCMQVPNMAPPPSSPQVSPDARIETADSTIYTTTTAPPIPPVMAPSTRARTTWCTRVSRARAPEGVCWSLTPQGALPDCIRQSHHHQRSCHCYRHAAS